MGVVYAAEDTHLRRPVAIKFLSVGLNRRTSKARFLREARASSVLNHSNIATVYDYGETGDGRPFIVMELLPGQTLAELLTAGPLSIERGVDVVVKVLEALAEAHGHGIVHRDLKPSNVMVGERGQVKVLDFGLAKSLGDEPVAAGARQARLDDLPTQTLSGAVLGTPLYVSPEQATGAPVDQRSDLFSLGAVLYECLAGRPAFGAPSVVEILAQVISPALPPPPSKYNPSVTSALDRTTLKALMKSPEARHQSAEEFLEDLRKTRDSLSGSRPPGNKVLGSSLEALYRKIVSRGGEERAPARLPRPAPARPSRIRLSVRAAAPAVLVLLLLLMGVRAYRSEARIDSVAVLPFANATQDEGVEYIGDALSEALIGNLSKLSDLKVISRNSVAKYKGQSVDPATVGAELNVRAVLTGRVVKVAGQLVVEAELVDALSRARLWGGQFGLPASDALAAQQEIAHGVVERLRGGLSAESKTLATRRPSRDPEAYDLYAKGRWYWNKMTIDGARQAVSYFQQAIDKDPDFALAYVGIAETYMLNSWVPTKESYMRAKAAAAKALELDNSLGEAHATVGFIKTHYERDWEGAEQEFNRAIELSPNYATAHLWYADNLLVRGKVEEYYREITRARELDPLSPIVNADIGMYYLYKNDDDRAIEEFKRAQILFPDFYTTHFYLGYAYNHKRMYPEAIAEYQQALDMSHRHSLVLAALGYTYAVSGDKAAARGVLRELEEMKKERNVSPYRFAVVSAGLGDKDEAFRRLEEAFEVNDIMLIYVNVTPFSDPLRGDPRFDDLIRRMGL